MPPSAEVLEEEEFIPYVSEESYLAARLWSLLLVVRGSSSGVVFYLILFFFNPVKPLKTNFINFHFLVTTLENCHLL
jgi:hypothetical protein